MALVERALKTFAQTLIVLLGGGSGGLNLLAVDWQAALLSAAAAALLSVLTSIGSISFGPSGSPSLVAESAPLNAANAPPSADNLRGRHETP